MKVEIRHEVDRVFDQTGELLQEYNHIIYDFVFADELVRARTYIDNLGQVSLLGRFDANGVPPSDFLQANPQLATGFPEVLDYLRDRFSKIQSLGIGGYTTIAEGFSHAELAERDQAAGPGYYQLVQIDIDLDGDAQ